jgi:hypothetical protein
VLPLMALRSCHLPGDCAQPCRHYFASDTCLYCLAVVCDEGQDMSDDERRWRHIQHVLLHCLFTRKVVDRPKLCELQWDLQEASEGYPAAVDAVNEAFSFGKADMVAGRAKCIEYMLDPVTACPAPLQVAVVHAQLIAAYIMAASADMIGTEEAHSEQRMRKWVQPNAHLNVCNAPLDGSDDEVWLRSDEDPPLS